MVFLRDITEVNRRRVIGAEDGVGDILNWITGKTVQDEARALASEFLRNGFADPGARACYDGNLVRQTHVCSSLYPMSREARLSSFPDQRDQKNKINAVIDFDSDQEGKW